MEKAQQHDTSNIFNQNPFINQNKENIFMNYVV